MRILDADGNELTTYDREKGYINSEKINHRIPAVEGVAEKGHYEVVKEYPNGGKDVEWIIDVPGVAEVPEHDEEEEIYRYTLYTEKELAEMEIQKLKLYLSETDWIVIKSLELGSSPTELYPEISQKRADARTRINSLEEENGIND